MSANNNDRIAKTVAGSLLGRMSPHSPDHAIICSVGVPILVEESAPCPPSCEMLMTNPAGESTAGALGLDFDRRLTVRFRGAAITSDAGLPAYRE